MFDEENLLLELSALSEKHRIAFGASCCEKLLPNYLAFSQMEGWGDHALLRQALDEVWSWLKASSHPADTVQKFIQKCQGLAPDTEEFSTLFVSAAGDAVAAVVYTLECCLDGAAHRAATIGRLPVETLYMYLLRVNDPDTGVHVSDHDFENQILQAPLMISELRHQAEVLRLLKANPLLEAALIDQIRSSSAQTGIRPAERGIRCNT